MDGCRARLGPFMARTHRGDLSSYRSMCLFSERMCVVANICRRVIRMINTFLQLEASERVGTAVLAVWSRRWCVHILVLIEDNYMNSTQRSGRGAGRGGRGRGGRPSTRPSERSLGPSVSQSQPLLECFHRSIRHNLTLLPLLRSLHVLLSRRLQPRTTFNQQWRYYNN